MQHGKGLLHMKKIISILSFFLILYIPYIVCANPMDELIDEADRNASVPGYSVSDTAHAVLAGEQTFTFSGVVDRLFGVFTEQLRSNWSTILKMTVVGILSGVVAAMYNGKNEIGTLACVAIASLMSLKTFIFFLTTAEETIDSMFLFMQAIMPPVTAATAATGQTAQTAACSTIFVAMQMFIYICKEIMLPFLAVLTALGVVNQLGDTPYLKGIVSGFKSFFKWGTGLLLTLYGVVCGLQAQGAGAFDTVAGKTVRYAVGSFVPLVGGALSESLQMIGTGAKTIRAALGISGIIGVGYVCLRPLIHTCAVALSYKISACLCTVMADTRVADVILEVGGNLVRICGVILSVSVMFMISLAMLCRIGGVS